MTATVTVPCDGAVLDATLNPVPASLASTLNPLRAEPATVDPVLSVAVGAMVSETVAVDV